MNTRLAVSLTFFINGALFACLACRIPDIQRHLGIDEAQLGLALLSGAVGAFVGVALSGRACAKFGSHHVAIGTGFLSCVFLPLLAVAPSLSTFMLDFMCLGACTATMDVAMNTNGVAVEKLYPRPIMSSLHGMFSLGGVVFAGVGWLAVRVGASVPVHFLGAAIAFAALLLCLQPRLLKAVPDPLQVTQPFALPERAVMVVGVIAFCAFLSEGAMGDWSAIYLRKSLHQSAAASTFGYLAFTLSMTATRFGGDAVLHRWGASATLRACGLITAIGMGAALWLAVPWLTIVGFASVGMGMATVAPIVFSIGGRIGGDKPDHAISSIATMSYTAFLVGPAFIGFIAKAFSLRDALGLVVILALTIVVLASWAEKTGR